MFYLQRKNNMTTFKLRMAISGVLLSFITSCTLERKMTTTKSIHNPRVEVAESKLYIRPVVADLKIGSEKKSVEYTADLKIPLSEIQSNALNLFLTTYNCDYVVDPIYTEVTTIDNSKLNSIVLKVTGYPATYEKLYQVESLPNSVVQSAQINLPVKRTDFINEYKENTTGKSLGLEFIPLGSRLFQIDYSKTVDGMHYYFSAEFDELGDGKEVSVDFTSSLPDLGEFSFSEYAYQYRNYSFGIFRNKEITNHLKCRAMLGVNMARTLFPSDIIRDSAAFVGLRSLGLRFGAGVQYEIINGVYVIGRINSDIVLRNGIIQDGAVKSTITNLSTSNSGLYKVGYGVGLRFEF
jgi:hypothetical protein